MSSIPPRRFRSAENLENVKMWGHACVPVPVPSVHRFPSQLLPLSRSYRDPSPMIEHMERRSAN
jgi:hypothetical protein